MRFIFVEFHELLKQLRTEAGLTQKQLGERIGVPKSVISYYELQERIPSPDTLKKIAAEFHVTTDYLLGIEHTKMLDVSGLTDSEIKCVKLMVDTLRNKNN